MRSLTGGFKAAPQRGLTVRFGRGGGPEVELPVGEHDQWVSRRHGELTYHRRRWWLRNVGRQLVRLPGGRMMHNSTDPIPLDTGYTPVFVNGSSRRLHVVELHVTGWDARGSTPRRGAPTCPPRIWPLEDDERLLLVVLGQHYLLYEGNPRPLTYRRAAEQLAYLRPENGWNARRIEYRVELVRRRLDQAGFPYRLLHDRDSETVPSDNVLLHNLLEGLVGSTTLAPPDLALMNADPGEDDPDE
ncbi:FHA domain-containing protein [Embleya scabrispora]|nr:FHA domain-containing protein [Embleya scabrispora]